MFLRKTIISFLLLFSAHFSVFSLKILNKEELFGNKLSSTVESILTENGHSPIQQSLSHTGQDNFAYNILLSFPETKVPDNTTEFFDKSEIRRTEVIFCFLQEDFYTYEVEILDFLNFLKNLERDWTATILFSALDNAEYVDKNSIKGTEVFASQVDDSDSCCAITIGFNPIESTTIYTGSLKNTTPRWLLQQITDAFFNTKTEFSFNNKLSAIYRLGTIKGQERLSYFFKNDIPAIEINFSYYAGISVIKNFAENYSTENSWEWDKHYIYIDFGKFFKTLFISERSLIIACLSVGFFTILLFCIFSFTGKNGEIHKYEFIKSSYMIPFTIGLSFLSLYLGQHFVSFLSSAIEINPIIQYGIKLVFSMLFISLLFMVQDLLKISVTAFIYGYLLLVVAIFNIFLFATIDLTLFAIFVTEYIIIYLSRRAKTLIVLTIFLIFMLLPFLPYGFIIISKAEEAELTKTVFKTAGGNLLLSLAIFPFQITWLRILIFLNFQAGFRGYTMRRIILNIILSTIIILAIISLIISLISHFIYKPDVRASKRIETKIERDERFTFSAKLSHDEFSNMRTNHINIRSDEDALRYEVVLKGEKSLHPIYDSIYDYTITAEENGIDSYSFIIPDYPPRKITIDYAAPAQTKASIEVTAFYRTKMPNTFRIEKRDLQVD